MIAVAQCEDGLWLVEVGETVEDDDLVGREPGGAVERARPTELAPEFVSALLRDVDASGPSIAVLVARLRALIRRGATARPTVLAVGDLSLDPASRSVVRGGSRIDLTAREFAVLEFLMRRAGEVVPKAQILDGVWDFAFDGDPNIVEVYIAHLRAKIDRPFGRTSIETLRGAGYRIGAGDG